MSTRFVSAAVLSLSTLLASAARADVVNPLTACFGGHGQRWCRAATESGDGKTCAECDRGDTECSDALTAEGYTWACNGYDPRDAGLRTYVDVYCKSTASGCSAASAGATLPLAGAALLVGLWAFSRASRRTHGSPP